MLDRVRITNAVNAALQVIGDAEDRRKPMRDFLSMLKKDLRWSDEDIVTVQSRVLRSLAQRAYA
jgi:hypothetical protein